MLKKIATTATATNTAFIYTAMLTDSLGQGFAAAVLMLLAMVTCNAFVALAE